MSLEFKSEALRKIAHFLMTRMTQLGSPTLAAGASAYKLDSAALTFIRNGAVLAGITFNEAVITSWDATNEPFTAIAAGKAARFLFLVDATSTITAVKARQGPIVDTGETIEFPKVPDGYIVIGGLEIDDPAAAWTMGDATGAGDLDDAAATLFQIFWPTNGDHGYALTTIGS